MAINGTGKKPMYLSKKNKMIGELPPHEIENLLHQQIVGRLGCHYDGITYVVPVSYAYDGTYLYIHGREGRKTDMMRKNPNICFETDTMQNMANWKSVIAWGECEELKDATTREEAIQCLLDRMLPIISSETTHLSPHWPFPPEHLSDIKGVIFRIRLVRKSGRFERNSVTEFSPQA